MPRRETEDGGHKDERQHGAGPAQQGRAAGARTHPGPADAAQPEREKEGGEAQSLQHQVTEIGAEEADPVVHRIGWGGIGGGVDRGVGSMPGGQRQKQEHRNQQQHEPQKQV